MAQHEGASSATTGLAGAEAPEPDKPSRPNGGIPSAALVPCSTPWCGHSGTPYVFQGCDDAYAVICEECQVEGRWCFTESDAVAAWNEGCDAKRLALEAGRRFLAKCNSAWSCGEPPHRVKDMLDAADHFQAALDRLERING